MTTARHHPTSAPGAAPGADPGADPGPAPALLPAAAPPRQRRGPLAVGRSWLWGWLAICQLVVDLLLVAPYLTLVALIVAGVAALPAALVGLPLVGVCLLTAFFVGHVERYRLLALTGVWVGPPAKPRHDQPTWRRLVFDSRPWRATAHLLLVSVWGLLVGTTMTVLVSVSMALAPLPLYRGALPDDRISLPLDRTLDGSATPLLALAGIAGLVVLPLLARGLVGVDVALARWLLGPGGREQVEQLSERVETLTQTRVATVDSVELERRRIERDLHDGPQQRLVAIAMDLGMARERLARDPEGARELLDKAHAASKEAITEMRQVARGIAPPVLTDRGLDAALSALAARSPVPVTVMVAVPQRPSPTLEAIAYFCVSEGLTNVAKHSGASAAQVVVEARDGVLTARISDDGTGGADPAGGTGLSGLRDRVRAVDGSLAVDSPAGGPTVLTVVLPLRGPGSPRPAGSFTPGSTS